MLPFDFNQAMGLFNKLTDSTKVLDALRDGLDHFQFQVKMTPLSLLMLIEIVEENNEVPASTTELYERYSDQILGRYDKDKGIQVLFEYHIKKSFLSSLAFEEFYKKNRLEISVAEFEDFVVSYLETYGLENDETSRRRFLDETERSNILDCRHNLVMFKHRSFLDYFTGLYIYNRRDEIEGVEDIVVSAHFDGLWNDIAFFYSGLKRDLPTSILKKILSYEKSGLIANLNKFLVGRLLQAAWYSPKKTKQLGVEKSIELAPILREQLLNALKSDVKRDVPIIVADFLVLFLANWSLRSTFLHRDVMHCFDQLRAEPSDEDVYKMLILLWSAQKFLDEQEVSQRVQELMTAIKKVNLSLEDEGRITGILRTIEMDESVKKSITRHHRKLQRKHPKVFKKILPSPQPGFRQRGKRQ
jgi:hypothetical protein